MTDFLAENSLTLLFIIIAIGSFVGRARIAGITIGPAAVLFTALAFSSIDDRLALSSIVGVLGLAIFAYAIGVTAGPVFFSSLRHGTKPILVTFVVLAALAGITYGIGFALDLDHGTRAGLYAGATTNTPGLAAALAILNGAPEPTVGYSLTYVGGVAVMLLAASFALKRGATAPNVADARSVPELSAYDIKLVRDAPHEIRELTFTPHGRVVFSRFLGDDGNIKMADGKTLLRAGEVVHAVGPEKAIEYVTRIIGEKVDAGLNLERANVDYRRIILSNKKYFGHTIAELDLEGKFHARATRVRRADQDLLASDDLVLQAGDRIRVAAPRQTLKLISKDLGDSEHSLSDINPLGFSIGMSLGLLIGAIPIPVPGVGTLELGHAAGPLLVGLVLGKISRTGKVVWSLPQQASETLTQLGLLLFLAYAGGRAGSLFVEAIRSPLGIKLIAAGLLITAAHAVLLVFALRSFAKMSGPAVAGAIAASQTQPAVLAYANEATNYDQRVTIGYALAYPVAMVTKILACQVLVLLA